MPYAIIDFKKKKSLINYISVDEVCEEVKVLTFAPKSIIIKR